MNSRHILLTTDFSEESQRAFEPVSRLAQDLHARVTLLHVVQDRIHNLAPITAGMPGMSFDPRQSTRHARIQLDRFAATHELPEGFAVATEVGTDVAATIVEYARTHAVDLIAMATHGHSGIRRLLLGSTAESVAHHSSVPVLLYPPV